MGSPPELRLLLDTHIWVWSVAEPARLSNRVASELRSPGNELWLSSISAWEVLILARKGRLRFEIDPIRWIGRSFESSSFREAPVNREVAIRSRTVDVPHEDPVDRFLAATAVVFELTLVTADERLLRAKDVPLLANR